MTQCNHPGCDDDAVVFGTLLNWCEKHKTPKIEFKSRTEVPEDLKFQSRAFDKELNDTLEPTTSFNPSTGEYESRPDIRHSKNVKN
jgi:hypothetical protein